MSIYVSLRTFWMPLVTSSPGGARSIVISMSVCLFVCPLAWPVYFTANLHQSLLPVITARPLSTSGLRMTSWTTFWTLYLRMTSRFNTMEANWPESSMTIYFDKDRQVEAAVWRPETSVCSSSSECGTAGGGEVCYQRLPCLCSLQWICCKMAQCAVMTV